MEIWKDVVIDEGRYVGRYQVSNYGNVRSHPDVKVRGARAGKMLFQGTDDRGYKHVYLYRNYKQHTVKVHRLVATSFIGEREFDKTVNHIDGDKTNNHVSNLEYVTILENIRHAHAVIDGRAFIEVFGERLCITEALEKYGDKSLSAKAVRRRIQRLKWNPEEALTTPLLRAGLGRGQNANK